MLKQFLSFFSSSKRKKTVLFYRNFQGFQGGHLKTWNYFNHLKSFEGFYPKIYFTSSSIWKDNPWKGNCIPEKKWLPESADILFLAGLDWSALEENKFDPEKPIINLIQHVRHADPEDIRYQYLKNRAIRICVSDAVASALLSTNCVNGPIYTIQNGINLTEISSIRPEEEGGVKEIDVLISGLKNKKLAMKLCLELLKLGIKVECQIKSISRDDYLRKLASSKVSLMLPSRTEGFYLPALESMALGSLVICPDCVGNRGFCDNNSNCYMPPYDFDSLFNATVNAMSLDVVSHRMFVSNAYQTASEYSLVKEKDVFHKIMLNIDEIWCDHQE